MAGNTDFVEMFHELGLSANCSLDEFKRAYRRCVAQLHPDRLADGADPSRLQRLTVTYDAALDFHRRHGRLPGYITQASRSPARTAAGVSRSAVPQPPSRRPRLRYVVALLALLLTLWAVSDLPPPLDGASPYDAAPDPELSAVPEAKVVDPVSHRLLLGMPKDEVRLIEGEPVSSSESQWEYGPSWISFKCGEVDDWYSSPLHPLRFASQHPGALDGPLKPRMHPLRCADDAPH